MWSMITTLQVPYMWFNVNNACLLISCYLIALNYIISIPFLNKASIAYKFNMVVLLISIYIIYNVDNLYLFYFMFETLLLPIFYTIYYHGETEDYEYTSYKFFYWTFLFSLF